LSALTVLLLESNLAPVMTNSMLARFPPTEQMLAAGRLLTARLVGFSIRDETNGVGGKEIVGCGFPGTGREGRLGSLRSESYKLNARIDEATSF
jgi:hypothetical protein